MIETHRDCPPAFFWPAFAGYLAFWAALAIAPTYRQDWLLENVIVFVAVPSLLATYRWARLSAASYVMLFVFLAIHAVGAHYTYSLVPYDEWAERLFGRTLNGAFGWQRNHFDRLAHFAYGALLAGPVVQLLARLTGRYRWWQYALAIDLILSTSALFELFEWAAAAVFSKDLGTAYVGTQGDVWDAQKDMALAVLGALIVLPVLLAVHRAQRRSGSASGEGGVAVHRMSDST